MLEAKGRTDKTQTTGWRDEITQQVGRIRQHNMLEGLDNTTAWKDQTTKQVGSICQQVGGKRQEVEGGEKRGKKEEDRPLRPSIKMR